MRRILKYGVLVKPQDIKAQHNSFFSENQSYRIKGETLGLLQLKYL